MKIALVVHDLQDHPGHSLYTKILANELSRRHNVTVFANRIERPADARWDSNYVRAWRGSALACVQTFPLGMRAQAKALASYEIRHTQGYCGGNPNVVTAHICVAAYLDSIRSIKLRNRVSLRMMALAESHFYRRYGGQVIAISQKVARDLRDFYQLRGEISVVPHGVDAERFSGGPQDLDRQVVRKEIGIDSGQTMALYVGDLIKSHTHLKAAASAAPEIQFVIVTASAQYRWPMRNVHFLAPTLNLARYYRAADAFVFPTTYDAFGMVALEAMASGLAVFSSDRAGVSELIHHGRDGFVIALDDWVETTVAGLRDRDLLDKVGAEARKTAQQHDWQTMVREVERIYVKAAAAEADPEVHSNKQLRTTETVAERIR